MKVSFVNCVSIWAGSHKSWQSRIWKSNWHKNLRSHPQHTPKEDTVAVSTVFGMSALCGGWITGSLGTPLQGKIIGNVVIFKKVMDYRCRKESKMVDINAFIEDISYPTNYIETNTLKTTIVQLTTLKLIHWKLPLKKHETLPILPGLYVICDCGTATSPTSCSSAFPAREKKQFRLSSDPLTLQTTRVTLR